MLFFQLHFLMRFPYHALRSSQTEEPEQGGVDEEVEHRGTDDAAQDDGSDRIENLFARLVGCEDERDEADSSGEGSHEYGGQTFESGANDHLLRPAFAFVLHKMEIVIQQ